MHNVHGYSTFAGIECRSLTRSGVERWMGVGWVDLRPTGVRVPGGHHCQQYPTPDHTPYPNRDGVYETTCFSNVLSNSKPFPPDVVKHHESYICVIFETVVKHHHQHPEP